NPGLQAAFNTWQAALEKIPQVRSLPDPKFTYGYFIREVETRVGPQRQKFGLSQMFPGSGKLAGRQKVARQAAKVAEQRYQTALLKLFYQVKEAYYEYYYLARAITVTEENVQLITYLEKVARTRYQAGAAKHADIIRAQVELGKLEDRLETLRELRGPVSARLNAALNRPSDTFIPWPRRISEEAVSFSDDQLLTQLSELNPELKAMDYMAARGKAAVELAHINDKPDVMVGLTLVDTDPAVMPVLNDSGKDPLVAMVSVNLPFFRQDKYRAAERQAEAQYLSAVNQRSNMENKLTARLKMVIYRFRDAKRKISLYRDTLVPKAKQAFEVTQKAFSTGKAGFLDLIDTQRTLLQFQLSFERSLADHAQRLGELEMLVARELTRVEEEFTE
ncbi:MAG: TolC family protein, partial [bacterium]|nr:TolC family protein [bacterium]